MAEGKGGDQMDQFHRYLSFLFLLLSFYSLIASLWVLAGKVTTAVIFNLK